MRTCFNAFATLCVALFLPAQATLADAGEEVQQVIKKTMPFAEELLLEHGEFFPFGGALKTDGEIVTISGIDENNQQPLSADVIDTVKISLRIGAENKEYKATALLYKVNLIPPGKEVATDAVAVEVDHVEGMSLVVVYPYTIEKGELVFGDVVAQGGNNEVFRSQ